MFGIGGTELVIILVFVLIIFGPDKLPELARTVGRAMQMFKDAQEDMTRIIKAETYSEENRAAERLADAKAASTGSAAPAPKPAPVSAASEIWSDEEEEEGEEE